jgi:phosphoribosylanthranilate isomerase
MHIKICGLTREQDVAAAVRHGADALGFVFARCPRRLDLASATRLTQSAGDGIMRVGVFMDQDADEVTAVLDRVALDLLQFHGAESDEFCCQFGLPFIKAVAMADDSAGDEFERFPSASGFLLDSHGRGQRGGTGETFDWSRNLPTTRPLWLAGGLNPDNVAAAIAALRPYAVDVSSGVEIAPGIKDAGLIRRCIENARQE